jgi:hypothetical protein
MQITRPNLDPYAALNPLLRAASQQRAAEVDPAVRASVLSQLQSQSGQMLESLGLVLDTPGAIARGILAGDPLSGFVFDSKRRVTGEELLDSYGLKPSDKLLGGWGSGIAGFATEVATDPLWWLQGLGAATRAGKAAANANVAQYATKAAMANLGDDVADVLSAAGRTKTGQAAMDMLEQARVPMTESTLEVVPIVGDRVARYRSTLRDVLKFTPADKRAEAIRQVKDYLGSNEAFKEALKQPLAGVFGFGPGTSWTTFSPFSDATNERLLDAADYLGQAARWNPVTRQLSALFQGSVHGKSGVADQIDAMKATKSIGEGKQVGELLATEHGQLLKNVRLNDNAKELLGADSLFSKEGNDLILRLANGKPRDNDLAILAETPGLEGFLQNWANYASIQPELAQRMGLRLNEYRDVYGNLFSPRWFQEADFGNYGKGTGRVEKAANIENMISRNPALATPGGDIDLRQISQLPIVREHAKRKLDSPHTDEKVGEAISEFIRDQYGDPMITLDQATGVAAAFRQHGEYIPARVGEVTVDQGIEIGRVMRKMSPDLPADIPAFSEHPVNAQLRYMVNTEVRKATARHIFDSVAEYARPGNFTQQPGETMRSVSEVVDKYAGRLGFNTEPGRAGQKAAQAMRYQIEARIARRSGRPLYIRDEQGRLRKTVDLKNYYMPEEAADRLARTADFYATPQAQEEIGNMFNTYTSLFKGFTLGHPSRFFRDGYSNLASIYLETGDAPGSIAGMWHASNIMAGRPEKAIRYLASIPRYRRHVQNGVINSDALLREFELDVGSNGVLSGLATSDLLTANREGKISQFIPGSTPVSIGEGIKELIPTGERNPMQMLQDFGAIRNVSNAYETRNPILNASQKIGDAIDSSARLGGFLALMRQGVGPQRAAQRMKAALVDYSSLTPFERHWMKNIFLWWSYQSRIGKYAVDSLVQNPGGRFAQMIRAVNDLQRPEEGNYVPTALRQQVAVRLPDWAQFNPGTTTYLKNIDLPGLDVLNVLQPGVAGSWSPINFQATIQELLNQSNPLAKTVGEIAFNTDLYSKRPLSEARTSVDKVYSALTGDPNARANIFAKAILQNAPLPLRPFSWLGVLADPNIENPYYRAGKIAMNELSGFKFADVDPEYEWLDFRNKAGQALAPYQNTLTVRSIPEESVPNMPLELQILNLVDKDVQRDLSELYRRKRMQREFEALQR